ncbi:MAG: hypothetical protein IJ371_05850 [Clostridia bacterium]|nr:hypothetical protein [Clostridia bacterium]
MACFIGGKFLIMLNISLLLLEAKKLFLAIKNKENFSNIVKVLIVWLSISTIFTIYSLIYNDFKIYRKKMFIDFIQCCVTFYLIRKNINIKHILFTLFAGIITSVAIGLIFNLANINEFIAGDITDRFGAFFNNVNTLSVYCTLCASSFVVLLLNNKLQFNKYFYFPIITSAIGLLTYSKAFILVNLLLYGMWFVLSFIKSNNKKKFILFSIGLIFVLTLAIFLAKDYVKTIIARFIDTDHSTIINNFTTGRADIWEAYLKRWLKSPLTFLFGNGYTASKIATNQYEHSIYIAFLYQFGIVGSIIIIGTLVWTIRKNAKLQRNIACYIPLSLLLLNGIVSNLSGILCTCLIWILAFYFVTFDNDVNNISTISQNNVDNPLSLTDENNINTNIQI